jgi:FdhD protein
VNGIEVVTLLTLGDEPVELGLGFLRSEGFFSSRDELAGWEEEPGVLRVRVSRDVAAVRRLLEKRTVTTGCGKGTTFYGALDALRCRPVTSAVTFVPGELLRRMHELQERSDLYRRTGGTHNASLVTGAETLVFRTDIGRHNAVDMIGGRAFLDGLDMADTALLTTGRVSSEILVKVAKMRVSVLGSRSAPTALALRLAEELGVTVVGYIRNGRFNVYTHPARVQGARPVETGVGHG